MGGQLECEEGLDRFGFNEICRGVPKNLVLHFFVEKAILVRFCLCTVNSLYNNSRYSELLSAMYKYDFSVRFS